MAYINEFRSRQPRETREAPSKPLLTAQLQGGDLATARRKVNYPGYVLTDFRPSIWGWKSTNVGVGACGGFCWRAMDRYYSTGDPPPEVCEDEFWMMDTWTTQLMVGSKFGLRVVEWEQRPDVGHTLNPFHSVHWLTRGSEWPTVKMRLDNGLPALVCEIKVRGVFSDPSPNHFVVAWGYRVDGDSVFIRVYDPNYPLADGIELNLTLGGDYHCIHHGDEIRGFFYAEYY